jgi:hypothetical protein
MSGVALKPEALLDGTRETYLPVVQTFIKMSRWFQYLYVDCLFITVPGAFVKLRKASISVSVCLSVRMEQLCSW